MTFTGNGINANEGPVAMETYLGCFTGRELKDYISTLSANWRYILEVSQWWGGFWKRMVQVVKRSLQKVLSKLELTYEELLTVICELE